MTKFEKIKDVIREYQTEASRNFKAYNEKVERAKKRYSKEAFDYEFRVNIWAPAAGRHKADADCAVKNVMLLFDEIEEEFRSWTIKPLDPNVLRTLDCIRNFDLKLSLPELQVIEKSVRDSYFGSRIFAGLANANGFSVTVPNMSKYIESLSAARANSECAIRAFSGTTPDFPGTDLLEEKIRNGVDHGEYAFHEKYYAMNFLKDGGEIDRLEKLWAEARAPMRYTLTPGERKRVIDKLDGIVDRSGKVISERAESLIEKEPDILSMLSSIDGYANKRAIEDYFAIFEKKEADEASRIGPSIPMINSPGSRVVDAEALKSFA